MLNLGISLLLVLQAAPPDEAACLELAKKIEASVREDGKEADGLLDRGVLVERSLKDTPGDAKMKAGFRAGLLQSFSLGPAVAKVLGENGGTYTFLRLRTEGGSRRALFRMVLGETFNYHDYRIEAGAGGAVKATDVHIFLSGEWLSETFRRSYLGMVAAEPGMLGKLTGKENEYVKGLSKINEMTSLKQKGQAAEALKVFDALPPEIQKDKMALLLRYQAAVEAAPEDLPKILADFEKAHPGDACLPAISIGAHAQAGRLDKALSALDAVDKSVGGDAYLDVQRGSVHLRGKAYDKAKAAVLRAMEREKGLADAYWTLVTISLEEKAYGDTLKWLRAVEKDLGLEIADLTTIEIYAGFVKSPEHAEWLKGKEKK